MAKSSKARVGDSDLHHDLSVSLIETIKERYRDNPNVYIAGEQDIVYAKGDRKSRVAPDVFLVNGVAKKSRDSYLYWEEEQPPELVIEITSKKSKAEDFGRKLELYRDVLNVKEYILFDPLAEWLDPPLQGFRRHATKFLQIRTVANGRLPSRVLGAEIEPQGEWLRFIDPMTNQPWPIPGVAALRKKYPSCPALQPEASAAEIDQQRQEYLQSEIARLQQELKEMRRKR